MDENRFSEAMADFDRRIESLPEKCKPALRALAKETRNRAAEIRESGRAGQVAAMELMKAVARLKEVNLDLVRRAGDLNLQLKYARFDAEARGRELRGEGRNHGD